MLPEECGSLDEVRESIDNIDRKIIELLGDRSRYVMKAAEWKTDSQVVRAPERVRKMLEDRKIWAFENQLDISFIENLFRFVTDHFILRENIRRETERGLFLLEDVKITAADKRDIPDLLRLQIEAYQSEAVLNRTFLIPPLMETEESYREDFGNYTCLKAVYNNEIVGSVRASEKDGTCYIGRLTVSPIRQGLKIGRILLDAIEEQFRHCCRFELFTSSVSCRNLVFYQNKGYVPFREESSENHPRLIFLEKKNDRNK